MAKFSLKNVFARKNIPENKMPSADSPVEERIRYFLSLVTFDTTDWHFNAESVPHKMKSWITSEDDDVALNFFALPPDLPRGVVGETSWRAFFQDMLEDGERVVEANVFPVAGILGVRNIIKRPIANQEHGLVYLGSWCLPFEHLSYVVRIQCIERGVTGTREAMLFAQLLHAGGKGFRFEGERVVMPDDWNPDAEEFDAEFPDHPVSRVRRGLKRLENSLKIAPELQKEPKFPLMQQ